MDLTEETTFSRRENVFLKGAMDCGMDNKKSGGSFANFAVKGYGLILALDLGLNGRKQISEREGVAGAKTGPGSAVYMAGDDQARRHA